MAGEKRETTTLQQHQLLALDSRFGARLQASFGASKQPLHHPQACLHFPRPV
jgi:hypothetical protein